MVAESGKLSKSGLGVGGNGCFGAAISESLVAEIGRTFCKKMPAEELLGAARLALRVALTGDRRHCVAASNPACFMSGVRMKSNAHNLAPRILCRSDQANRDARSRSE